MNNKSEKSFKIAFFITIAIILNIVVITVTSLLYSSAHSEEKRAKRFLSDKDISIDELGSMVFEYEAEYTFKEGETQNLNANEVYYWNGNKFVLASDFMKGYDD